MQKFRKFVTGNLLQNLKNYILSSCWPKYTGTRAFQNIWQCQTLFKLDDTLTACKKSENFYERFLRKTTDKETNGQNDEMYLGYIIRPLLFGLNM